MNILHDPNHDSASEKYDFSELRDPRARQRPVLARRRPAVIAGVCRGLSVHVGGHVAIWRLLFFALIPFMVSPIIYLVLAVQLPRYTPALDIPVEQQRIVRPLEYVVNTKREQREPRNSISTHIVLILLLVLCAVAIALSGLDVFGTWSYPVLFMLLILGGGLIAWAGPLTDGTVSFSTVLIGATISAIGAVLLITYSGGISAIAAGFLTGIAVLAAIALVIAPIMAQLRTNLIHTNEEKIREAERADIAAHLHDSVLQTLSLIRARAHEPDVVSMLARSQEQDLRRYLYEDRPETGTSLATELRDVVQELERRYQHEVDIVVTGDASPSPALHALVAAAGEAITNACKHGGSHPVSVYAELSDAESAVWVRDRGEGFDLDNIGEDRAGIRESLIGRMERVGGHVKIRTPLPNGGTEVYMSLINNEGEK
ncbi:ATP-binding protein [Arcanobacterium bovis]|uniref:ATP-binding protein n=1 Tax=Arcanobacterium bovis TaxID=2529275 RepID=UPI0013F15C67|nr:ATP-binding protein [Arcanobacterium bovis]